MSISDGHAPRSICYTKTMHEPDVTETDFPPLPPPPPMTVEQRAQAEASIQAALAREAERRARLMEMEECREARLAKCVAPGIMAEEPPQEAVCDMETCASAPMESDVCGDNIPRKRSCRKLFGMFSRRRTADLPTIDLPENKPRKPNLHAANLSFAARVIIWVRDRYANNAPAIYKAAYLSRKTYSAIISDENHVVSKRTAIQLAFALRLTREEADLLLHAAGYHLSRSVVEDMIFDACLEASIHNLEDVNHFLLAYECRPFVPQV